MGRRGVEGPGREEASPEVFQDLVGLGVHKTK